MHRTNFPGAPDLARFFSMNPNVSNLCQICRLAVQVTILSRAGYDRHNMVGKLQANRELRLLGKHRERHSLAKGCPRIRGSKNFK
jgi:hypothetical protein